MTGAPTAAERVEAARALLAKGRAREAAFLVDEVLQKNPRHGPALVEAARIHLSQGDVEGARAAAERAVRVAPADPAAVMEVGNVRLAEGNVSAAQAAFEQAVEIAPEMARCRAALAEILIAEGDTDAALAQLHAALDRSEEGEDADVLLVLGNLLSATGETRAAEAAFRRVVALDPQNAQALHNLGNVAATHGRPEEALACAERAHLLKPADPAVLVALAQRLADAGRPRDGLVYARRAIALFPQDIPGADTFARLSILTGAGEASIRPLLEIVRREPGNAVAGASLAGKLRLMGRIDEALAFAERVLAMEPGQPLAETIRRDCLLARGRPVAPRGAGADEAPEAATASPPPQATADGEPGLAIRARATPGKPAAAGSAADGAAAEEAGDATAAAGPEGDRSGLSWAAFAEGAAFGKTGASNGPGDAAATAGSVAADHGSPARQAGEAPAPPRPGAPGGTDGDPSTLPAAHGDPSSATAAPSSPAEGTADGTAADVGPAFDALVVPAGTSSLEALVWLRFARDPSLLPAAPPAVVPAWLAPLAPGFGLSPVAEADDLGGKRLLPLGALAGIRHPGLARPGARVPYLEADAAQAAAFREALAAFPSPRIAIAWAREGSGLRLADLLAAFDARPGTLVSVMWDELRHDLEGVGHVVDAGAHLADPGIAAAALAACDAFVGPDGVPLHLAGALGLPGIAVATPAAPWYLVPDEGGPLSCYPTLTALRRPFDQDDDVFRQNLATTAVALLGDLPAR